MFFGRRAELNKLNEMYDSGAFEFAVIYGRRRIGKTTLIREFVKDKKYLFFAASESTARVNLVSLSSCIGKASSAPVYRDFESALEAVFDMAKDERIIFVIDEYPYLAEAERSISSLIQILIDHKRDSSKLFLILCGSSMSFMENQVLGNKSPLYGRRTAQLKILPFYFFDALPFYESFGPIDRAVLYGATGGIPEYLSKIDRNKSVKENITSLFLNTSGNFFEEPSNLLKQELREPATYNAIIQSIAWGASKLNEIATKAGIESNKCAKYLSSLINLGLIKKEYPYGEAKSKRSIYKIQDQMFRFWYRFVFPNFSAITAGLGVGVYEHEVEGELNAYMGHIFEDICKQWFFLQANENRLPFFVGDIGRYWGTNPRTRTQEEIDLMAARKDNALFAECKWQNALVGAEVYHELKRKSEMFRYENPFFFIFAKNGFDAKLKLLSSNDRHLKLISLADMSTPSQFA